MKGYYRRLSRTQAQRDISFMQKGFSRGWINDMPGSDIPEDGMALLENFTAFPEYLEGRSGTQKFSDTALPGSGTIYSHAQHTVSKKWVLHRGTQFFWANATQTVWNELLDSGTAAAVAVVSGDTGTQLSGLWGTNISFSNTFVGTAYWELTNSGSTRTFKVYRDAAKAHLVSSGSRVGDGFMYLHQQNNSGMGGFLTVTYTGDDIDSGNTLTYNPSGVQQSFGSTVDTRFEQVGDNFFVFAEDSNSNTHNYYIDLANSNFFAVGFAPAVPVTGTGAQGAITPYGYRYVYTLSRIVNKDTGALDNSVNRISGDILFESPPCEGFAGAAVTDYGEFWLANPIDGSNSNVLTMTTDGTLATQPLATIFSINWTHISLYRTLDIGVKGIDPVSGAGNNREIFVWVNDFDITVETVTDTKEDDELRARFSQGFGLKNRFWRVLPIGSVGVIGSGFIYVSARADNKVYYGQLNEPRFIGFYNPAYQFFKLDDGVQIIAKSTNIISFICSNKTYISSPSSYFDATADVPGGSTFVLNNFTVASATIGCTDYGSFAPADESYIAHCSDHTVRVWNNYTWSDDISNRGINNLLRSMVNGSTGAYVAGAYLLAYRVDSGVSSNTLTVRLGMGRETGIGWQKVSGAAWPALPLHVGASLILDANSIQRLIVFDAADGYCYWVETFTGYTGSGLTKTFKDKVATNGSGGTDIVCTARFREITASDEALDLYHKETHIYDRPYSESAGYLSGYTRTLKAYVNGSSTASGTVTPALAGGDLQFFDLVTGNRVQMEIQTSTSGVRITGITTELYSNDRAAVGSGPADTTEASYQAALAGQQANSLIRQWLTRPQNLLNRYNGVNYTLTGTAPTNVTGPDGRVYALSFGVGASYTIAMTTQPNAFTAHFWVKSTAVNSRIFQITGATSFYVTFTDATTISINGTGTLAISSIATGWHDFWLVRSGTTVTVYQNGVSAGTITISAGAVGGTSFDVNPDGFIMSLFDVRLYIALFSAATIAYYYSDVNTTLQGNKVLPLA